MTSRHAHGEGGGPQNSSTANSNTNSNSSAFSNISMTTMIHVAVEILVVGGLAYYLHSKIKTQEESNKILSDRITKLEEIVTKQNEIITLHENALRQFHALVQGLPAPNKNPQKPPNQRHQNNPISQHNNPSSQHNSSNNPQQRQPQSHPQSRTKPQKSSQNPVNPPSKKQSLYQPQVEEIEEAEVTSGTEESGDVDEIDDLLHDEINELGTEIECNDDECVVPTQKGKKKSSK